MHIHFALFSSITIVVTNKEWIKAWEVEADLQPLGACLPLRHSKGVTMPCGKCSPFWKPGGWRARAVEPSTVPSLDVGLTGLAGRAGVAGSPRGGAASQAGARKGLGGRCRPLALTPGRSGSAAGIAVKEAAGFRFAHQGGLSTAPAGLPSPSWNFVSVCLRCWTVS